MKQAPLVLSILALLGVIALGIMQFSGKPGAKSPVSNNKKKTADAAPAGSVVAYVNVDSLFDKYDKYQELKEIFQAKTNRSERDLRKRQEKLQQKMQAFQRKAQAGLMSQNDIKAAQEDLMVSENEIMQYQQTVATGLRQEELDLQDTIYNRIASYVERYNEEKGYQIILGVTKGGGVLYADQTLEITDAVLEGLNEEFQAEKKAQKDAASDEGTDSNDGN